MQTRQGAEGGGGGGGWPRWQVVAAAVGLGIAVTGTVGGIWWLTSRKKNKTSRDPPSNPTPSISSDISASSNDNLSPSIDLVINVTFNDIEYCLCPVSFTEG